MMCLDGKNALSNAIALLQLKSFFSFINSALDFFFSLNWGFVHLLALRYSSTPNTRELQGPTAVQLAHLCKHAIGQHSRLD